MAEKEDKLIVRAFKEDKTSVWCNKKHFKIMDGELVLCAGGLLDEVEYNHVLKYFKNKKLI